MSLNLVTSHHIREYLDTQGHMRDVHVQKKDKL